MMIGPRNMGAGTQQPRIASEVRHTRSSSTGSGAGSGTTHGNDENTHRTPAQRLIDQYERLSTPPPAAAAVQREKSTRRTQYTSAPARAGPVNDALRLEEMARRREEKKRALAALKKNAGGRSPIRQSLRNLLAVIKQGTQGLGKRAADDDRTPLTDAGVMYEAGGDALPAFPTARALAAEPTAAVEAPVQRRRMTGLLMYLSRAAQLLSPDVPGSLVWTACSVTIDVNKLIVTSFTGDMDATVHEIALRRCINIRSLTVAQLTAEEARALERTPECDDMRVFELIFNEGKEKFAAKSVRERAGWINAIWNSIIPPQEEQKLVAPPVPEKETNNAKPIESPRPQAPPKLSPPLVPSRSERSLPPLPTPTPVLPLNLPQTHGMNKANLHLDLSDLQGAISPSIYPPTPQAVPSPAASFRSCTYSAVPNWHLNSRRNKPTGVSPGSYASATSRTGSYFVASPASMSAASSPAPRTTSSSSRPSSPSVAHLSQLSVVRQRLAQIERKHSQISEQSPHATPLPSPASSSGWSRREAVFHNAASARTLASPVSPLDRPVIVPQARTHAQARLAGASARPLREVAVAEEEIVRSKEEITNMAKDIADVKGALGCVSGKRSVHEMVRALERHARDEKTVLREIREGVEQLGTHVACADDRESASAAAATACKEGNEKVVGLLREVKERLTSDLPALAGRLEELKSQQERNRTNGLGSDDQRASSAPSCGGTGGVADLKPVLDKLEEMRSLFTSERLDNNNEVGQSGVAQTEKLLSLMQEESSRQTILSQQQADSVRYLNELNMWLEAFVNNGTSQIQGISANLGRLCRELGCADADAAASSSSSSSTIKTLPGQPQSNLVNDIRQLVAGMKARDQNFTALQAAVHSLLDVLTQSQMQQQVPDSQALVGIMDRQRHDQEMLLRAFTNEISGEIKGERLRFVEAMKEATAFNVQLHVDQFKQELSREVMAMAEEVGGLQRERQRIEAQISDMYSFYSKHKQENLPLQTIPENVPLVTPVRHAGIPRSQRRIMAYPRQ